MSAQKLYIPALDGLRGLAILVVIVSHYGLGTVIPGGFGVTLFFFISGFLITRLLIHEYEKTQRIALRDFYLRRVLRLYPALLFMVALAVGFTMFMNCGFQAGEILSTLFYYRNYYMLFGGALTPYNCSHIFDITWSLAIEEHFYLLFPLLFMGLYRRPTALVLVMIVCIAGALVWRLYLVATDGLTQLTVYRIYHLTDTRLDAIMFGCLASLILHLDHSRGRYLRVAGHPIVFVGATGLLLSSFLFRDAVFRETWRYSIQALALSGLIPAVLYVKRYTGLMDRLSTPWLVTVGKWSYSLYLFHWVGVCVADSVVGGERLGVRWWLVAVPLGLLLSLISYYHVEKPTAGLRKRFGSTVDTSKPADNPVLITDQPSIG